MSTVDRALINRRNGKKIKRPRTAEEKLWSRLDALEQALPAPLPVVPDEDGQVFRVRVDGRVLDLKPRNDLERSLAEHAVRLSEQHDGIGRTALDTNGCRTSCCNAPQGTGRQEKKGCTNQATNCLPRQRFLKHRELNDSSFFGSSGFQTRRIQGLPIASRFILMSRSPKYRLLAP